eukprot:2434298-Rhodomonas_salina.1
MQDLETRAPSSLDTDSALMCSSSLRRSRRNPPRSVRRRPRSKLPVVWSRREPRGSSSADEGQSETRRRRRPGGVAVSDMDMVCALKGAGQSLDMGRWNA